MIAIKDPAALRFKEVIILWCCSVRAVPHSSSDPTSASVGTTGSLT